MSYRNHDHFVDPSLLADFIRKNDLIALAQIPKALESLGFSPHNLGAKIRRATAKLLQTSNGEFQLLSVFAHPGAVDSWALLWRASQFEWDVTGVLACLSALRHNWAKVWRPTEMPVLCRAQKTSTFDPHDLQVQAPVWASAAADRDCLRQRLGLTTSIVLRTSVWIDLLRQDQKAAVTWKASDRGELHQATGATYIRRDHTHVMVAIPHLLPTVTDNQFDLYSRLNEVALAASIQKKLLEVYSLRFPTRSWVDQSPSP